MENAKRVWIYCRTAYDDGNVLSQQEQKLVNFAKRKGWLVVGITVETGSGLDFERKGLREVMQAVKSKQTDIVLAQDLARIGRDISATLDFLHELFESGVEFTTPIDHNSKIKPWQIAVYFPPWVRNKTNAN